MGDELLDQAGIDALLDAVDAGEVGEEAAPLQIFSRFRREREPVDIKDYDFKRPERISKDQMRALHTMHETFARNFGAAASGFLRSIVEVRVSRIEQITYAEFTASLPNPTCFTLVQCPPLTGQFCLELSPLTIYPIIDRLLGGSGKELFVPQRAPTLIEQRLVRKLLDRAMQALQEAWAAVLRMDFALEEMESNPQLVQIVPPNEVVVAVGFEVRLGSRIGAMNLCIPSNTIESILDKLSAQNWTVNRSRDDQARWGEQIQRELAASHLEMDATLAETSMTLRELRDLEPGDLILTGKPSSAPVVLAVGGRPKFLALLGRSRGARALRILRPIGAEDRY